MKDVKVKLDEIQLLNRFYALFLANHLFFQIVLFSILQPLQRLLTLIFNGPERAENTKNTFQCAVFSSFAAEF